ncbi:MAG: amidohydrolase [Hyphomicrobiales bacterium]|nr:amidohydrolase [Hyphomicrobiales bacterium]
MIVDSQLHVWPEETPERPYPAGERGRAHLPEALTWRKALPLMDAAGIDRAILVPPGWTGDLNEHSLEAAQHHRGRFAVMGRFEVERPQSRSLLATWKRQPGMLGIRLAFNHESASQIVDGTADWVWGAAESAAVPIMLFAPDAPQTIGTIAAAHPQLKLIIDHMGQATRGPQYKRVGERLDVIAPLARYPNVAVKLSMVPGFSKEPYPFKDMTPHLRRLIEAFGPRRCFFGSDLTHQRGQYPYRQYVTHFEEELAFLPAADLRLIMGEAILDFLDWR